MSTVRLRPVQGTWTCTVPGDLELELVTAPRPATYVRADKLRVGNLVRYLQSLHRVTAIATDDGVVRRLAHRTPERTA